MLGRRFTPRIRGLESQRIYRIDKAKDYGAGAFSRPLGPDHSSRLDLRAMGQDGSVLCFFGEWSYDHINGAAAIGRLQWQKPLLPSQP